MTPVRTVIEPKNTHLNVSRSKNLPHNPGIRVGDLVFLSGMVAVDPSNGKLRTGTMEEETRMVLSNMKQMLQSAGTDMENAVKITVNLSDIAGYGEMNRVYREFFGGASPPACSVNVVELSFGLKIEIECMAVMPAQPKGAAA
jgi:2-iminobutanoate/2-iminopropanoate deaminase